MTAIPNPVAADQLRLLVEMGDDYTPSARVAAALHELRAALEADDADVEGFGMELGGANLKPSSFAFDSLRHDGGARGAVYKIPAPPAPPFG